MPNVIGLGDFAKNALSAYVTLDTLDREREALDVKKQTALIEALKRQMEMRKLQAEEEDRQRALAGASYMTDKLRGTRLEDVPAQLPDILAGAPSPQHALAAAKAWLEATGGSMPWGERLQQQNRAAFSSVAALEKDPQKLALYAIRLNIPPNELANAIPDEIIRRAVLQHYMVDVNRPVGQATGLQMAPGTPLLPGQPAPPRLGLGGKPLPEVTRPSGELLIGQANREAAAKAAGEQSGTAQGRYSVLPGFEESPSQLAIKERQAMALAAETPLDKRIKESRLALDDLERTLRAAQVADNDIKRAEALSRIGEKIAWAQIWTAPLKPNDPMREYFGKLLDEIKMLSLAPRKALPSPTPAPSGPPKVLEFRKIENPRQ